MTMHLGTTNWAVWAVLHLCVYMSDSANLASPKLTVNLMQLLQFFSIVYAIGVLRWHKSCMHDHSIIRGLPAVSVNGILLEHRLRFADLSLHACVQVRIVRRWQAQGCLLTSHCVCLHFISASKLIKCFAVCPVLTSKIFNKSRHSILQIVQKLAIVTQRWIRCDQSA